MPEERTYPVRDLGIVAQERKAYAAKIAKNKAAGARALSSGEYPLFKGWSAEDSARSFDTVLELDEPSQIRVIERVVKPLHRLAQAHNIPAIYPGTDDCPPHVVLQPGRFTNLSPEQVETLKQYLASNKSHLNWFAKILEGLTFHHDTLVIAAPTTYICAGQFDAEQGGAFRARQVVEKIFTHAFGNLESTSQQPVVGAFKPIDYHDIFHSSVMRFTGGIAPAENMAAFTRGAYATVGEDLRRNPLPITIANLYRGLDIDYQRMYAPNLVIPI